MKVAYFVNPSSIHDCKWINLLSKKCDVIVCCMPSGIECPSCLDEGIPVYPVLLETLPRRNVVLKFRALQRLKKILRHHGTQIIHSTYAFPNAFWASEIKFHNHVLTTYGSDVLLSYQRLLDLREKDELNSADSYVLKRFETALRHAKVITSTSHGQLEPLKGVASLDKLHLIRTGVDTTIYRPAATNKALDRITLFSPRVMGELYQIDLIVEAFAKLVELHPELPLHLSLINDQPGSPYANKVLALIDALGISEKVTVLGKQNNNSMVQHYQDASLVIMLPKSDGTPNSALEAMLVEKPVILSPLDYDRSLFNADTIWQTPGFKLDDIVKTIETLLDFPPDQMEQKLKIARETATKEASLQEMVDRLFALYQKIL